MSHRGRTPPALHGARLAAVLVVFATARAAAQTRIVVLEEPDATAVGVAVVLNAGGPWEMDAEAGLAHLAALAVVEQIRPQLEILGGRAAVACHPAATSITLVLPPATWRLGTILFLDALFHRTPAAPALDRARERVLRALAAQDEFTRTVEIALLRALFGDDPRWSRAWCGRPDSVASLEEDDIRRVRETRFRPSRATAAVAGPVAGADAREIFAELLAGDALPVLVPAPAPGGGEMHVHVAAPTVTTWLALAFPFPAGTDAEALRVLGFLIHEALGPSPARPDVYDVRTAIERHGDGGWLAASLITAPDRAAAREAEVRALVRRIAGTTLPDPEFEALLLRYRGARLLELASPEARAHDAALQLFFDRALRTPAARRRDLTADHLRRAAAALGPAASATLGPP